MRTSTFFGYAATDYLLVLGDFFRFHIHRLKRAWAEHADFGSVSQQPE